MPITLVRRIWKNSYIKIRCQLIRCWYRNIPAITPEINAERVKPGKNKLPEFKIVLLMISDTTIDHPPTNPWSKAIANKCGGNKTKTKF